MELLIGAGAVLALLILYFFLGVAIKFLLTWWILLLGTPVVLTAAIELGWAGVAVAFIGLPLLLRANNKWTGSGPFLSLERRLDRAFYFSDT